MAYLPRDTLFAGHVIGALLGAGRVAEVYDAVAPDGGCVALKVVKQGVPLPAKPQARLGQEGEAIASIEHVNVVRFHGAGIEDGRVFLLMERVLGPNLRQLVAREGGALPVERAVRIVRQACEGVAAAHALGILHRDLRPENVLVAAGDLVKVADFGSANVGALGVKTTTTEQALTTELYAAPECHLKRGAEARSDVYSMGVLLYEILAGVHPIAPGPLSVIAIVERHFVHEPPALDTLGRDVPFDVSEVVRRAMAKDPAHRPSMREMADLLARALWKLHAPRRAVAGGLPLPNRPAELAATEPAMPAFAGGGTVRMEAVVDRAAAGGGGAGGEGDRWAVPAPAPVPSSGAVSGPVAVSSGAPTRRSPVEAKAAAITVAEDARGSSAAPVEARARVSRGPRRAPVVVGGMVVAVGLAAVGWGVWGTVGGLGDGGMRAPAVGSAGPPGVRADAGPAGSGSAGKGKAPAVPRPGPRRGRGTSGGAAPAR